MAVEFNGGGELPNWLMTIGASAITAVGAFVLGLVNRGPAMQAAITEATKTLIAGYTEATKTLIAGYEKRVFDLTDEVHSLREEVVSLRKALDSRSGDDGAQTGFGHEPVRSPANVAG